LRTCCAIGKVMGALQRLYCAQGAVGFCVCIIAVCHEERGLSV
jgi:hypothetical protein